MFSIVEICHSQFSEEKHGENKVDCREDYLVDHRFDLVGCVVPSAFDGSGHVAASSGESSLAEQADKKKHYAGKAQELLVFGHNNHLSSDEMGGRGELVFPRGLASFYGFAGAMCHSSQRFPRIVTVSVRPIESIPAGVQQSMSQV